MRERRITPQGDETIVSRRNFLKTGAIAGALTAGAIMSGGLLAGCTDEKKDTGFALTEEEQKFFADLDTKLVTTGFQPMSLETVKSFYHQDPHCRFCDADGPYMKGWEEYSKWLGKIFSGGAVKQKFNVRDVYSYRVAADTVISTMLIDNKTLLKNNQLIDSTMRLSLIWRETSDGWKVIHEHFSKWTGELADMLGYPNSGKVELEL